MTDAGRFVHVAPFTWAELGADGRFVRLHYTTTKRRLLEAGR